MISLLPDRLFITGTDTGVGKTVTTAALVASMPGAIGLKPLATGVPEGSCGEDAALLALAGDRAPEVYQRWTLPVSPHRAAMESGVEASLEGVMNWIHSRTRAQTYVEGVGGWRVPISLSWGIPDLAQALGWPVLVVAANRLGVLNHTLLTVQAVRQSGLEVCGIVLNQGTPDAPGEEAARQRNLDDLQLLLDLPVGTLDRLSACSREELARAGTALRHTLDTRV